ncbi:MAG TPA: alpha/beta hydrolase domain-containing protein [Bryobacteraceae bacterium]|nr:alpha/beta hydrolase domain-containing protein [Bryobacteraceae bacterium]
MLRRNLLALCFAALCAQAAVTRVEITERTDLPIANYEKIVGKVYFAVDPKLPNNQIIRDIGLAPVDSKGLVEFSSDLYVLRPKDPKKSNGTALLEISNRGGKGTIGMFDLAPGGEPKTAQDYGDPMLFESGYTLVWVGWEWDVPPRAGLMHLYAPVIKGITGPVRSQIVTEKRLTSVSLGDRTQVPYAVADLNGGTLTVRDDIDAPRTTIPRDQWHFSADGTHVEYAPGFEPGRIYDVVYTGKDPAVVGLGPAAVRDYISYIKQNGEVKRAIAFGTSQSGRFLRNYVYDGFNADEQGRQVFDGVWAHVAGAGRGNFNYRFAQPSRDGMPRMNLLYAVDEFPFTDSPESDAGRTDSILARANAAHVLPKMFYTNGSFEYWGRAAALIHTSLDGQKDVAPVPTTRVYYLAGTQHGANARPQRTVTQNTPNPADYRFVMRALLVAMNDWITTGAEPPDSQMPRVGKDNLVQVSALNFPKIPGVSLPKEPTPVFRYDRGPDFLTKGIISIEPPKIEGHYTVLIPQVDKDGNETSGIRLPDQVVPLATYTGWNLRDPQIGAPDAMFDMVGSMIPFARTKAERDKAGDPRPSIEERYTSREEYLKKVEAAAQPLVRDHLMLERDVPKFLEKAAARWDMLTSSPGTK